MKTKELLFIILLALYSVLLSAQNIENGVYYNERGFICVKNDTVLRYDGLFWYKGEYRINNKKIFFINNELLGKNALITKEKCDNDTIKFKLITKTKHYVFGEPDNDTTIYDIETPLFTIALDNIVLHAKKNKGIIISSKSLPSSDYISHGFWIYDEGSFSGFQDFFNIPINSGTYYIIKQKYYDFRPLLVSYAYNDSSEIIYNERNKELILNDDFRTDIPHPTLKYISPNCDSCFKEFKNRFPLLFE